MVIRDAPQYKIVFFLTLFKGERRSQNIQNFQAWGGGQTNVQKELLQILYQSIFYFDEFVATGVYALFQ